MLPIKLMGLKSLIFIALFLLGINAIEEAFRDFSNLQVSWSSLKKDP
jgi:hypothetical protein